MDIIHDASPFKNSLCGGRAHRVGGSHRGRTSDDTSRPMGTRMRVRN